MKKKTRRRLRRLALVGVAVLVLGAVGGGWYYLASLPVARVEVAGTRFSAPAEIAALAKVDTSDALFEHKPKLIADRVSRHPWVARANATRLPNGVLLIEVEERVPVALVLDGAGRPLRYLDRAGYPMPATEAAVYDVPILHGVRLPQHPTQPLASPNLRELLGTLARLGPDEDALVSDLSVGADGEVTLYTAPTPRRSSLTVRLGKGDYGAKFNRLKSFWRQAVLTRPEHRIDLVDLRFSSQIITRETY